MDLLKAVNIILPWMEENKVTTVDTRHPTVSIILSNLDHHRGLILDYGYWFNREERRYLLTPDSTVEAPENARTFYTKDKNLRYEIRGDLVYDLQAGSFTIPEPFEAVTLVDLPFDELPEAAANLAVWRACIDSYLPDFGVTQSVTGMQMREQNAQFLLEREHLRKSNYGTQRSPFRARYLSMLRS